MDMTIYTVLYIHIVLQGIFNWVSGHGHCGHLSGLGAGHPPCQLISNVFIVQLICYIVWLNFMATWLIYVYLCKTWNAYIIIGRHA